MCFKFALSSEGKKELQVKQKSLSNVLKCRRGVSIRGRLLTLSSMSSSLSFSSEVVRDLERALSVVGGAGSREITLNLRFCAVAFWSSFSTRFRRLICTSRVDDEDELESLFFESVDDDLVDLHRSNRDSSTFFFQSPLALFESFNGGVLSTFSLSFDSGFEDLESVEDDLEWPDSSFVLDFDDSEFPIDNLDLLFLSADRERLLDRFLSGDLDVEDVDTFELDRDSVLFPGRSLALQA